MRKLVSGEAYVAAINQTSADRDCRGAFQNLAMSLLKPGDTLFDFGCGPGLDARHYAERGVSVIAYDIDPDMRNYFDQHCATQLACGTVRSYSADYQDFLDKPLPWDMKAQLVTANFAPVNLAPDPRVLFERFKTILAANGHVLVSVLNPTYAGDARYAWWWRNLLRLLMGGQYSVTGAQAPITRYLPRRLGAMAAPHFSLKAAYEDRVSPTSSLLPSQLPSGLSGWRRAASCRFLFLLFRAGDLPE